MHKLRYQTLDAIRGTAALGVFSMHANILLVPLNMTSAYLAVDIFFLMSGVVLDRAYGDKLSKGLSTKQFLINRYIRLYPLYLIGAIIGVMSAIISFILGQGNMNIFQIVIASTATLALTPSPTFAVDSFVVPFNYVAWSLLFELFVNAMFAMLYRRLSLSILGGIIILSAIWFVNEALNATTTSLGAEWPVFRGGFPRVIFSFFVGVFLSRLVERPTLRTDAAYLLAVLPVFLFIPIGGVVADITKIIILFPAIVALALIIEPKTIDTGRTVAGTLGLISYPLYALHVPVIQLVERTITALRIDKGSIYAPFPGLILGAVLCFISLRLGEVDLVLQKRIVVWRRANSADKPDP